MYVATELLIFDGGTWYGGIESYCAVCVWKYHLLYRGRYAAVRFIFVGMFIRGFNRIYIRMMKGRALNLASAKPVLLKFLEYSKSAILENEVSLS